MSWPHWSLLVAALYRCVKSRKREAEGAEGDFMNTTVNDGSETDESHSDEEERSEDSAAMKESDDGEVGSNAVGVDVDEGVAG